MANQTANQGFDPVRGLLNLRDSVNQIVQDGISAVGGAQSLPLDIYETEQSVIVKTAPILGAQPETIDVSITGDSLTIKGETRPDGSIPADSYLRRERKYGPFSRTVIIPRPVKPDAAIADFKDGVLTITIPKTDDARPHTINIGMNQSQGSAGESHTDSA
jgi:HSP20 family protein